MSTPVTEPVRGAPAPHRLEQVDAVVATARRAADQFRSLDQAAVDRIVLAMVQAGLTRGGRPRAAGYGGDRVRRLRGQGDQELRRHRVPLGLPQGQAERRRDRRGPERRHRCTSPSRSASCSPSRRSRTRPRPCCSRRSSPRRPATASCSGRPRTRCARRQRAVEILAAAGEAAGLPAGALQVIPDAANEVTHYLFGTRGGLPLDHRRSEDRRADQRGRQAVPERRARATPRCTSTGPPTSPACRGGHADLQDVRRLGDLPGRADLHRGRARLRRGGGRVRPDGRGPAQPGAGRPRWPGSPSAGTASPTRSTSPRSASRRRSWPAAPGSPSRRTRRCCWPSCPTDLAELAEHPLLREKLMPVLGLVRSPDVRHGIDAAVLVTEHGGLGHTAAVYAKDDAVVRAYSQAVRTGRILVNAPDRGRCPRRGLQLAHSDPVAGLRDLGRVDHHRQRQLPEPAQHQDGLAPPYAAAVVPRRAGGVYFNAGALANLAALGTRERGRRHRRRRRAARPGRRGPRATSRPPTSASSPRSTPEPDEARDPRRGSSAGPGPAGPRWSPPAAARCWTRPR